MEHVRSQLPLDWRSSIACIACIGLLRQSLRVQPELSKDQKAGLTKQLSEFEATLKTDGSDVDALEGAAVTAANLGDFKKAESLLARLTEVKREDVDVWRLLAETRSALKQAGPAVAAYQRAFALAPADLEVCCAQCYPSCLAAGRSNVPTSAVVLCVGRSHGVFADNRLRYRRHCRRYMGCGRASSNFSWCRF